MPQCLIHDMGRDYALDPSDGSIFYYPDFQDFVSRGGRPDFYIEDEVYIDEDTKDDYSEDDYSEDDDVIEFTYDLYGFYVLPREPEDEGEDESDSGEGDD